MKKPIQVILLSDVPSLGQKGEARSVRFGFAKNWLIPKKLACIATPALLSLIQKEKVLREDRAKQEAEKYEKLIKELEGLTLRLRPKKTTKGTLYSAIDSKAIAGHLKKKDILLDPKFIQLEKPLKKVGAYEIEIIFSKDYKTKLKVIIH